MHTVAMLAHRFPHAPMRRSLLQHASLLSAASASVAPSCAGCCAAPAALSRASGTVRHLRTTATAPLMQAAPTSPTTTQQPARGKGAAATAAAGARHPPDVRPQIKSFVDGMLTRDFISASLYAAGSGYFNNNARVFGSVAPQSIPFRTLKDKDAYQHRLADLYKSSDSCWVTPVELFKPFYAQSLARWILDTRVKELGPLSVPKKMHPEQDGQVAQLTEEQIAQAAREEAEEAARLKAGASANPHAARSATAPAAAARGGAAAASAAAPLPALRIIEMGGGNGTCALGILDYLAKHYPALYEQTEYTIVELSEVCHRKQQAALRKHRQHHLSHPFHRSASSPQSGQRGASAASSSSSSPPPGIAHLPRLRLLHMSMIEWRELHRPSEGSVFVLGLEVLDNMPHDRVRRNMQTGELEQLVVRARTASSPPPLNREFESERFEEFPQPLQDRWVGEYASYAPFIPTRSFMQGVMTPGLFATLSDALTVAWAHATASFASKMKRTSRAPPSEWYPTTQLMLLHILRHYLPRHHLLLADFDSLPSTVEGVCAPVVASKDASTGGRTVDHRSHLVALGSADIFFPTDFAALHMVYQRVCMDRSQQEVRRASNGIEKPEEVSEAAAATAASALSTADTAAASSPPSLPVVPEPRVLTTYQFMRTYAAGYEVPTSVANGWSPLHRDYVNMSFFLASANAPLSQQ